jgi:acetolactate synthase-1/2/3 large subunit
MKLTDYVIDFLVKRGISHVFGLTGGGVVHLFDSADKNPGIQSIFCHHEQAAALAAVAYARINNKLGAAIVTTGPGGTNAITGVLSAWQDSIPCIFISGQARLEHTSHGKPLRQIGTQEFDIVTLIRPITKYAAMVEEPARIRYHLEKAAYLVRAQRPGPVWIDIPLNFQWNSVIPDALEGFDASEAEQSFASAQSIQEWCRQCCKLLAAAKRPLLLAGYGIRLSHGETVFRRFLETLQIPFVSSWTASDIVPTAHPLYAGRLGIAGQRGGNLAVYNCDLLICLGSHLSIPLTGTLFDAFAREAKIVMIDIDKNELDFRTVRIDLPIHCDVKRFLDEMLKLNPAISKESIKQWQEKCLRYKSYNLVPSEWRQPEDYVNGYVFMEFLSDMLECDDIIVVDGGGTVVYTAFQAFKVKEGQRLTLSSGICAMGTGLPESVGACFANNRKRTICITGDGSLQLNIQELQTILHHNLPIKIFVMNNAGYLAIRHTQDAFLESNYVGSAESGGLSLPDFLKVAEAYKIKTVRINNNREIPKKLQWVLREDGPVVCELMVSPRQQLIVQQGFDRNPDGTSSPRPLEDMYPYLDRKEFLENMIVEPWDKALS